MSFRFFLFHLAIFWKSVCQGQMGENRCLVKGQIKSYKTKANIEARIVFQKEPNAALTVVSMSGPNGYKANLFERGHYLAIVSAEGFVSEQIDFDLLHDSLKSAKELFYHFELIPIQLNGVLPFHKILFEASSSKISNESVFELERLRSMLEENPGIKIRLEGHTDMGKSRKSMALARDRIESVKNWLIGKGISGKRIKLKAVGGGKDALEKTESDQRKANRRVEIRVIEM